MLDAMHATDASHRLAIEARRCVAYYDADHSVAQQCVDQQLERFPDHPALELQQLSYLDAWGRPADRLACWNSCVPRATVIPCSGSTWRRNWVGTLGNTRGLFA